MLSQDVIHGEPNRGPISAQGLADNRTVGCNDFLWASLCEAVAKILNFPQEAVKRLENSGMAVMSPVRSCVSNMQAVLEPPAAH